MRLLRLVICSYAFECSRRFLQFFDFSAAAVFSEDFCKTLLGQYNTFFTFKLLTSIAPESSPNWSWEHYS